MNYEELYQSLIKQVDRATKVLQQYFDMQPEAQTDVNKDFLYDIFLIDAIPNGITQLMRLITEDEHWLKINKEMGIPFIQVEDSQFVLNLYASMKENQSQAISTLAAFGAIAGDDLLQGLLRDITGDLDRTEARLRLLEAKFKA